MPKLPNSRSYSKEELNKKLLSCIRRGDLTAESRRIVWAADVNYRSDWDINSCPDSIHNAVTYARPKILHLLIEGSVQIDPDPETKNYRFNIMSPLCFALRFYGRELNPEKHKRYDITPNEQRLQTRAEVVRILIQAGARLPSEKNEKCIIAETGRTVKELYDSVGMSRAYGAALEKQQSQEMQHSRL